MIREPENKKGKRVPLRDLNNIGSNRILLQGFRGLGFTGLGFSVYGTFCITELV